MNGAHHLSKPIAPSVFDPALTNAMMVPAQAKALIRFSVVNLSGFVPA